MLSSDGPARVEHARLFHSGFAAPPSPPGFFLHSYMHNIAAASPHELADGEPEPTEMPSKKQSLIASIACIACCSVLIFVCWVFAHTSRTSAAEILLRNATLAALVAAQSRAYSQLAA